MSQLASQSLRNDVWQELAFYLRDQVFQYELAFLQALNLQLIERCCFCQSLDDLVEIAVLRSKLFQFHSQLIHPEDDRHNSASLILVDNSTASQ